MRLLVDGGEGIVSRSKVTVKAADFAFLKQKFSITSQLFILMLTAQLFPCNKKDCVWGTLYSDGSKLFFFNVIIF